MAATNIIVGSDVAFVTDVSGTVVLGGTPLLLADKGIAIMPVAAQMDGVASVAAAGRTTSPVAGQMDGVASMLSTSVNVVTGAAAMDGHGGMAGTIVGRIAGVASMNGVGGMVGSHPPPGLALGEMNGVGGMVAISNATGPTIYSDGLTDTIIGAQVALSPHITHKLSMLQGIAGSISMKPLVRYKVTAQAGVAVGAAFIHRMKFVKTIRDVAITMTPSLEPHSQFHYDFTFPINVQPTLAPDWSTGINLVQSLLVSQTTNQKFIWGRTLTQALKILTDTSAGSQYKQSLAQLFRIIELEGFKLRHPVALHQDIDLSLSLAGAFGLKLLQKLLVAAVASPALGYHFTLTNQVILGGTLEHLVNEILAELFTVHDILGRQFIAGGALSELLTVHPALNNKLVLEIVGDIQLNPEQLVSMLYAGDPLLDEVVITALYVSPSGTTTTWAVNTRTAAVTEYLNYDFQSFAQMGDRYIAAGAEGLYELDGDTDDGALIVSRLMSGYLQLNEKKLFGIKGAYVAIRGGGRFYLKLMAGDGREYIYELKAQPNLMTTKVKVGKGISTTYMAFELVTEGQDFDLDSIEFIPMTRGRRV